MATPSNTAAVLPVAKAYPMKIEEAPYPTITENEILVQVGAIACNPMDWKIQEMGDALFSWLPYPYVGGTDLAGKVVEVGSKITNVKVGDRVTGYAASFDAREGAFQNFAVLRPNMVTPIPDDVDYAAASVLPMGISTAACGLYQKDFLALEYPGLNPKPTGKTLLVSGGSSSVGTNVIQLAIASGYEVFTTASPKNFEYCKKLGASQVFDYHSESLVQDLVDAFKGKVCAGGFAVSPGSEQTVANVVAKVEGSKFVASAPSPPKDLPEGVTSKMIFAGTLRDNEVGGIIYNDFLEGALAQKKYQCLPEPLIVGHGLEKLQEAFEKGNAGGISAQKIVVTL